VAPDVSGEITGCLTVTRFALIRLQQAAGDPQRNPDADLVRVSFVEARHRSALIRANRDMYL
jgi:hypothetical protein